VRALFLQHDPGSQPGLVGDALERHGYGLELLEMSSTIEDGAWHGTYPDPLDHDLLVPMGAVWSLYDRSQVGSWIDAELELLRRADAHGIPVLGICFGAQALSAAHGGEVTSSGRLELGWTSVDTDDPELIPPGPWMQWHGDVFTVPSGGKELARNDVGPQAFRLRRNLGVQFHPEVDRAQVARWMELAGPTVGDTLAAVGLTVEELLATCDLHGERARADVDRMIDRFVTDVARS
jgi:GMP synthase-like glutamine amidotransferase